MDGCVTFLSTRLEGSYRSHYETYIADQCNAGVLAQSFFSNSRCGNLYVRDEVLVRILGFSCSRLV